MDFGRAERVYYKDYIVPIFGGFLQKCYCKLMFYVTLQITDMCSFS